MSELQYTFWILFWFAVGFAIGHFIINPLLGLS